MVEHKLDIINPIELIKENAQSWYKGMLSSTKRYVKIVHSFDLIFFLNYYKLFILNQ